MTRSTGLPPDKQPGHSDDELAEPAPAQSGYYFLLQNPYAKPSLTALKASDKEQSVASRDGVASRLWVSIAHFEAECRRIFRQYIPSLEKGKLRDHHRDFITRNKSYPGDIRHKLLEYLRKYDLSATLGVKPLFNRERDDLTVEKLREIELLVFGKK